MLEHSRGSSGERRSVYLNGLFEKALRFAYHDGPRRDAGFNIMLEGDFADAIASIELVPRGIRRLVLRAPRHQLGIPVLADGTSP
jgi:two-component system NtrC family sensor kinase